MQARRLITMVLAVLAVTVAVVAVATLPPASTVLAQPEPPSEDEGAPGPMPPLHRFGGEPEFGPGPGFPGGPGALSPFARAAGAADLRIHGDHVYVLHGNTLYQFAAEDLKLVKKVSLQEEPRFGPPAGRRRLGGPRPGSDRPQPRDE